MRKACGNLSEVAIEAGHNVQCEKPDEVNAAVVKFLVQKVL
jgi:soluble epoxide hydrolase/lipid-phosphate phosphatase